MGDRVAFDLCALGTETLTRQSQPYIRLLPSLRSTWTSSRHENGTRRYPEPTEGRGELFVWSSQLRLLDQAKFFHGWEEVTVFVAGTAEFDERKALEG